MTFERTDSTPAPVGSSVSFDQVFSETWGPPASAKTTTDTGRSDPFGGTGGADAEKTTSAPLESGPTSGELHNTRPAPRPEGAPESTAPAPLDDDGRSAPPPDDSDAAATPAEGRAIPDPPTGYKAEIARKPAAPERRPLPENPAEKAIEAGANREHERLKNPLKNPGRIRTGGRDAFVGDFLIMTDPYGPSVA